MWVWKPSRNSQGTASFHMSQAELFELQRHFNLQKSSLPDLAPHLARSGRDYYCCGENMMQSFP